MRGEALRPIVIAAGGTGGHLFPAQALAAELAARGQRVVWCTDARAGAFTTADRLVLRGGGLSGRGAWGAVAGATGITLGAITARAALARMRPAAVVGFGGYPAVAPILAAATLRPRPVIVLHEQNAILGRANRLLARMADRVALSFAATRHAPAHATVTGNPVRPGFAPAPLPDGTPTLLVTGGSQGARILADLVPAAVALLPAPPRVVQQCRAEDLPRVRAAYAAAGIEAELAAFFPDMPARLAAAHLVIARAGASTVAELAAVGRHAILIPLPGAIDDHQAANAAALAATGAATVVPQAGLTPALLAGHIAVGFHKPSAPAASADAAATLADLVLDLIARAPVAAGVERP